MYCLCSRMTFEFSYKFFVFHKIKLKDLTQPRAGNLTDVSCQSGIHFVHIFVRGRHIIRGNVFALFRSPDLFDIDLKVAVITDHIAIYFDKVLLIIIRDSL